MSFQDYISKNALIHKGPPARYQLRLNVVNLDGVNEQEEVSKLRRCTLGKKNPNKSNKTILLVGETGSGKSTFINSLVNYAMGVKSQDKIWFEIIDESEKSSSSKSQTVKVSVYEIFGFEDKILPFSLTIIDTPGYGDTRGIDYDAIISQKLHDLFRSEDGIKQVDAVGLVVKASDNRLTDRLNYIFNGVVSLFGKDMEEKIVALITHSDGMPPKTALTALQDSDIKCAKNEKDQPVHFVFNNCLSTQLTEDTEFGLEQAWALTNRGMRQFTNFLKKASPQKVETTVAVLNERIRLGACINNMNDRVEKIQLKQKEIQQTQKGLEENKEKLKKDENFTIEVDEPYNEKEDINEGYWLFGYGGAVTCNVCEENCHYPGCTMAWYPKHCEVMKEGLCTVCTNRCPASDHVKEQRKWVNKTRKVEKTIEGLKKKYEDDQKQSEDILATLQREEEKLEKEKNTLLEEAYQHVINLEQTALKAESLFTHVYLDFLIEKMKEKGDRDKVQKLKEMNQRVDVGVKAGLQYMFGGLGGKMSSGFQKVKHGIGFKNQASPQ